MPEIIFQSFCMLFIACEDKSNLYEYITNEKYSIKGTKRDKLFEAHVLSYALTKDLIRLNRDVPLIVRSFMLL